MQGLAAHDTWNWIVPPRRPALPDAFTAAPPVDDDRDVPNSPLVFRLMVGLSADGRWLQFSQTSERLWIAFLRALGLEWMLTDPDGRTRRPPTTSTVREEFWER